MPGRFLNPDYVIKYKHKAVGAGTRQLLDAGCVNPGEKYLTKKEKHKRMLRVEKEHKLAVEKNERAKAAMKTAHLNHGPVTKK